MIMFDIRYSRSVTWHVIGGSEYWATARVQRAAGPDAR
jgi:hypothetical protein